MALSAFKKDAICPKCHGSSLQTRYRSQVTTTDKCNEHRWAPVTEEHLDRICGICNYVWAEAVLG